MTADGLVMVVDTVALVCRPSSGPTRRQLHGTDGIWMIVRKRYIGDAQTSHQRSARFLTRHIEHLYSDHCGPVLRTYSSHCLSELLFVARKQLRISCAHECTRARIASHGSKELHPSRETTAETLVYAPRQMIGYGYSYRSGDDISSRGIEREVYALSYADYHHLVPVLDLCVFLHAPAASIIFEFRARQRCCFVSVDIPCKAERATDSATWRWTSPVLSQPALFRCLPRPLWS